MKKIPLVPNVTSKSLDFFYTRKQLLYFCTFYSTLIFDEHTVGSDVGYFTLRLVLSQKLTELDLQCINLTIYFLTVQIPE